MRPKGVGKYDTRVTFYRNNASRTTNTDGQRVETAQSVCSRWVDLIPITVRTSNPEVSVGNQLVADIDYKVRLRSDATTRAFDTSHWLTLADTTRLDILRIYDPTGERRELELACRKRI